SVKPMIGSEGDITLTIRQELSSVDKSVEASDIVTNKRQITTTLKTRYGETIALAGMTSKETQKLNAKVPILGDIPVLGLLFTSESETQTNKTLTVLIKIEKA
uniref:type II secretion system protein GspD n=4 Tax=Vibrio anguillarum TaxID=55601 RepID=UPI001ECBD6B7|nr:type II secretion system protein GspD [Vibrio anguillarum]